MSEKPTIGFIGVGFMGHGLAANILKNGYPLVIKEIETALLLMIW